MNEQFVPTCFLFHIENNQEQMPLINIPISPWLIDNLRNDMPAKYILT